MNQHKIPVHYYHEMHTESQTARQNKAISDNRLAYLPPPAQPTISTWCLSLSKLGIYAVDSALMLQPLAA